MDSDSFENFAEAARWVESLVRLLDDGGWDAPGLGDWDMRALVGHTSRALLTVETYLAGPAAEIEFETPEDYFARLGALPTTDAAAVLERGVHAGQALGADPARQVSAIADRVIPLVRAADDRAIATAAGGMLLSAYLPTRTFELVVHGLDIAAAAGLDTSAPERPMAEALGIATRLAVRSGRGENLLFALTGRTAIDKGFSVLDPHDALDPQGGSGP